MGKPKSLQHSQKTKANKWPMAIPKSQNTQKTKNTIQSKSNYLKQTAFSTLYTAVLYGSILLNLSTYKEICFFPQSMQFIFCGYEDTYVYFLKGTVSRDGRG